MNSFDLPPRRYCYDEIAAYPDEARRELHDGTPVFLYAPGFGRSLAYCETLRRLSGWLARDNAGSRYGETFYLVDWQLDEWNSTVPDLCSFQRERTKAEPIRRGDGQCLIAAPDLVICINDGNVPLSVWRTQKRICIEQGVPFYWELDLLKRKSWSFSSNDGEFYCSAALQDLDDHRGDFTHELFPGAKWPLQELFGS